MKIKNRIKRHIKKLFIHGCENCGICVQSSVKVKLIEKNLKEKDE
jgi:hypothetical protein